MRRVFITGTAGFIGFHLSQLLLEEGFLVQGYDALTDYYDVGLKKARHAILARSNAFQAEIALLEDMERLRSAYRAFQPDIVVHLAGQAGVRYSLENPRSYIDANIVGTFNLLECVRESGAQHLLLASTSSVYGGNTDMPFRETQRADAPLTIYAATKKAGEAMAHSYASLWNIPTTAFRFFTVYGPWGRPDMALFKFTEAIIAGRTIDVYNHGELYRDFTYVTDLVKAIRLLIDVPPVKGQPHLTEDSLSPAAPFRVVNIGNSSMVRLLDMVEALEEALGRKAIRNYLPMQPGDVPATLADTALLHTLTGFRPDTDYREGVRLFVEWYRSQPSQGN
ncbi:NAD-dependent epimerase/dehydratase family protein [Aestuariivirga sp.]|jgi:UDP-glucuronate 4-epimerase|uniref:NAD-dependent epimerase/dehydratase family protein n=1 Tax=Aestuariivirga sp. TaxID=2650926 RepID=UPI0037840332